MGNKVLVRGFYDSVRGHVTVLTFILTFLAKKKKKNKIRGVGSVSEGAECSNRKIDDHIETCEMFVHTYRCVCVCVGRAV